GRAPVAPRIHLTWAVIDRPSRLFDPTVALIGFDEGRDLGSFIRADGAAWTGSGLGASQTIINAKLAQAVEAKAGDELTLNFGGPRGLVASSGTVFEVVRNEGRATWNDGNNLLLRLSYLQAWLR